MNSTDSVARVPVAGSAFLQFVCMAGLFLVAAFRVPAVEMYFHGVVSAELFASFPSGRWVLGAAIVAAVVAVAQLAIVRNPVVRSRHHKWGIALALLGIVPGVVIAYGAIQIGYQPDLPELEARPRGAAFAGILAGSIYAIVAVVRLATLLFALRDAPPSPASPGAR